MVFFSCFVFVFFRIILKVISKTKLPKAEKYDVSRRGNENAKERFNYIWVFFFFIEKDVIGWCTLSLCLIIFFI